MPTSLPCDMCGDELAVTMVTNLGNGDSLTVGEACQLIFHLAVARELITSMPGDSAPAYYDQVTALLDAYGQLVTLTAGLIPAGPDVADSPVIEYQAPTEGPADEHAEAPQDQPADDTGNHAAEADIPDRPR